MTDNLTFKSTKEWLVKLGLDAKFQELVTSKTKLDWGSSETFSLDKKFDQLLHVWYKAERLSIEKPLGAGPGQVTVERQKAAPGEFIIPGAVSRDP